MAKVAIITKDGKQFTGETADVPFFMQTKVFGLPKSTQTVSNLDRVAPPVLDQTAGLLAAAM